jgi:glycyl-tRNA synthetase alpha chain
LFTAFGAHEKQAQHLMGAQLALPAYEQVLKAAHTFNLLDARGAISVTERAAYIGRIRNLARSVALAYWVSRARLGFPMASDEVKSDVFSGSEKIFEQAADAALLAAHERKKLVTQFDVITKTTKGHAVL